MLTLFAIAAVCLMPPVEGEVVNPYAPEGPYSGHWGVDFAAGYGSEVVAPASGRVTFAGSVAGMLSVTVEPVPGLKVSVSYVSSVAARKGEWVRRGDLIGHSGFPHGIAGVHMSTRVDGVYVDPEHQLGCRGTDVTRALRLVTPPQPYPRSRAHRHPRRDFRSDPHRAPPCRGDRSPSGGFGPGPVHTCG